jgi:cytochrome c553
MTHLLNRKNPFSLLGVILVAGGCTWGMGGGAREVPEMHQNLSRTVDIQTGVVQGDLSRVRSAAAWIVEREDRIPFPPEGRSYKEEILRYAGSISQAQDLRTAASQIGQLAAACGGCHEATGGGPNFVVGNSSPGGDSQEAMMIRHLWAVDRMWEGLVGPSEEAWIAGAEAMSETEPALAQALRESAVTRGSEDLLREINVLATEALNAHELGMRAEVYGRLLNTCNRCHSAVGE